MVTKSFALHPVPNSPRCTRSEDPEEKLNKCSDELKLHRGHGDFMVADGGC